MKAEISESKKAQKDLDKAPIEIVRSYEVWARLVEEHGLAILRKYKGYHDEKLRGEWLGYRSSRLNKSWRVIYLVDDDKNMAIISVERVTPHDYRRKK